MRYIAVLVFAGLGCTTNVIQEPVSTMPVADASTSVNTEAAPPDAAEPEDGLLAREVCAQKERAQCGYFARCVSGTDEDACVRMIDCTVYDEDARSTTTEEDLTDCVDGWASVACGESPEACR